MPHACFAYSKAQYAVLSISPSLGDYVLDPLYQ